MGVWDIQLVPSIRAHITFFAYASFLQPQDTRLHTCFSRGGFNMVSLLSPGFTNPWLGWQSGTLGGDRLMDRGSQ